MPESLPSSASAKPSRPSQAYRVRNQEVVVPEGYLAVAHIVGVHGLRGEVKLELYTDFPARFEPGAKLMLGQELKRAKIASVRPHKNHLLVRFEGVTDRTAAEELRDRWLFIAEKDAAELDEGTYWIHDILGLNVVDESGALLGEIVDVLSTGANDVYVVRPSAGQNKGQEILVPAIADVILEVKLVEKQVLVRLPDGLIAPEIVD